MWSLALDDRVLCDTGVSRVLYGHSTSGGTLCARGKSVFHHRRRRANMLETEVQADFAFLTTRGEVVSEDAPGTIKVLVLTELSSGCIGYVVVESDVSKVRTQICRWLEHFGL